MGNAVARCRQFPFMEHRDMQAVLDTERLQARYERREMLGSADARRLQSLQSRAVMPTEPEPPSAA